MRAAIPQAARLRGGQTAATFLGDFDGFLTQTAIVSASAILPHQATVGIIHGPPLLHGKPSCPLLLVLRSRPRQLAPARGAWTAPASPPLPAVLEPQHWQCGLASFAAGPSAPARIW